MTSTSAVPSATRVSGRAGRAPSTRADSPVVSLTFKLMPRQHSSRVHRPAPARRPPRPARAPSPPGSRSSANAGRSSSSASWRSGAHRFTDIVAGTGAPRDRIAARLKALTEAGVVERRQYQTGPDRFDYHLTESGRALLPVLDALLAWGREWAVSPDDPDLHRHRTVLHAAPRRTDDRPADRPPTSRDADWGPERSRTVTWHDPTKPAEAGSRHGRPRLHPGDDRRHRSRRRPSPS